jgi:hypothetical protein
MKNKTRTELGKRGKGEKEEEDDGRKLDGVRVDDARKLTQGQNPASLRDVAPTEIAKLP